MPRQRRWQPNRRLVYERERRGWSQDDGAREAERVADRLGLEGLVFTAAQFGRWERGESRPRPPLRRVVCQLYDASAEALGLLDQGDGTANRRTAIKAITVMGGLGALSGRRLLTDAADAAVAASRKRAKLDPMTLEELDQDVERFALDCLAISHADLFPQVWDDWQQVEQFLDARQDLKKRFAPSDDMIAGSPEGQAAVTKERVGQVVGVADSLDATLGRGGHLAEGVAGQVGQLHALQVGPQRLHGVLRSGA